MIQNQSSPTNRKLNLCIYTDYCIKEHKDQFRKRNQKVSFVQLTPLYLRKIKTILSIKLTKQNLLLASKSVTNKFCAQVFLYLPSYGTFK